MKAMISVKKNCSAKNAAGNLKKIEIAKKANPGSRGLLENLPNFVVKMRKVNN